MGSIQTVAGSGRSKASGDGGSALKAGMDTLAVTAQADGGFLIGDWIRVRRVSPGESQDFIAGGCIGHLDKKPTHDGGYMLRGCLFNRGPSKRVALFGGTVSVASLPNGGFLFKQSQNGRAVVMRVSPRGWLTTVAGGRAPLRKQSTTKHDGYLSNRFSYGVVENKRFSGDGGPASKAEFGVEGGIALLGDGSYLIADYIHRRIRKVFPNGKIETVVGTGRKGFSGDGGPANKANLGLPVAVAVTPDGGFVVLTEEGPHSS